MGRHIRAAERRTFSNPQDLINHHPTFGNGRLLFVGLSALGKDDAWKPGGRGRPVRTQACYGLVLGEAGAKYKMTGELTIYLPSVRSLALLFWRGIVQ